jgi:hypothetical protein
MTAKAVESTEGYILCISGPWPRIPELLAGQMDKTLKIALPQIWDSGRISGLKPSNAIRDGPFGRHRHGTSNRFLGKMSTILSPGNCESQTI